MADAELTIELTAFMARTNDDHNQNFLNFSLFCWLVRMVRKSVFANDAAIFRVTCTVQILLMHVVCYSSFYVCTICIVKCPIDVETIPLIGHYFYRQISYYLHAPQSSGVMVTSHIRDNDTVSAISKYCYNSTANIAITHILLQSTFTK